MDRNEKLRLSADGEYGYCFKQGLFVRLYEQSLYWFVTYVRPLKPMLERVKGGEPVLYGGLPVASFEALLSEVKLVADATESGWQWRYATQPHGTNEDFLGFSAWREAALVTNEAQNKDSASVRNILHEIHTLNLAHSTPMQVMSAVAGWQEYLRNWEGAG